MAIEIFDCEQGSEEWHRLRMGIPTASRFADVLGIGTKDRASDDRRMRANYLGDLVGERLTGELAESFSNAHIERGKALEDEARKAYVERFLGMDYGAAILAGEISRVGFIKRTYPHVPIGGEIGCSPDCLIGTDGGLEIKTALPRILIDKRRRGIFPPEHAAQCHGNMLVTDRRWWDLAIYSRKMGLFVCRLERNPSYLANLSQALNTFNRELAELEAAERKAAA